MISLASSLPIIQINDFMPDGILTGLDAEGRVVVCIQFTTPYHFIWGSPADQDSVAEWHVCRAHALRLAATSSWRMSGYECHGNA